MKVKDVIEYKGNTVYRTTSDTKLLTAIDSLNYYHIGALLVMDGSKMIGIVTERDILNALSKFKDGILKLKVADVMTTSLITCSASDSIESVMEKMTNHHIRHLPVFESKKLVGIVSIGDMVHALMERREKRRRK
ncbi:MAG: CBS domain-containing protein [bacterium]|nr:MAG: CBS domain-containing protein [bacterium]